MPLALVIIVQCEGMFYSELRKALNFPPRKKERSKQNKCEVEKERWGKKKRSDRMRAKGGKMKKIIHFPLVLH